MDQQHSEAVMSDAATKVGDAVGDLAARSDRSDAPSWQKNCGGYWASRRDGVVAKPSSSKSNDRLKPSVKLRGSYDLSV